MLLSVEIKEKAMPNNITSYKESLESCLVFSPRDWSKDERDAWLYGVIVGWGHRLPEIAKDFGWNDYTKQRLLKIRRSYVESSACDGD